MTSLLEGACRITAPTDDRATFAITRLNPDSDRNQLCSCVEKDKVKKRRKRERESNLGWSKKVEYRREGGLWRINFSWRHYMAISKCDSYRTLWRADEHAEKTSVVLMQSNSFNLVTEWGKKGIKEETCSKTAWPVGNEREGHQMSGLLDPSRAG